MGNCVSVLIKQSPAMMILSVTPTIASTAYQRDFAASSMMSIVTQMYAASVMGIATQEHALLEQFVGAIIF